MTLTLHYHPLASYCWKVLVALYEHGTPFARRTIDLADAADRAALSALWPPCRFPVLQDADRVVAESSIIVEYLDRRHPGPRPLVPRDPDAALEVRLWDRVLDGHVMTPMQGIVLDRLRDARADLSAARAAIATAYVMLDARLARSPWLAGDDFTLADCAAAPALFYAVTVAPFPPHLARLAAYLDRLVERPSVQRTIDEARPYFASYPFADALAPRFRDVTARSSRGSTTRAP